MEPGERGEVPKNFCGFFDSVSVKRGGPQMKGKKKFGNSGRGLKVCGKGGSEVLIYGAKGLQGEASSHRPKGCMKGGCWGGGGDGGVGFCQIFEGTVKISQKGMRECL